MKRLVYGLVLLGACIASSTKTMAQEKQVASSRPTTATSSAGVLPGFECSTYFDEQIKTYTFEPDVKVHINAPAAAEFDPRRTTRLVFYALPNGNTTEQTIGKQCQPDRDWHFYIQHIGAQTRRLREIIKNENLVVAYLEAKCRSWPTWRRKHEQSGQQIIKLIDSVRDHFDTNHTTVDLVAHSGGGSLIFGYVNEVEEIPPWIRRIVFLDANYGYSDEQQHGDKFLAWLRGTPEHYLGVVAYDDRRIRINGKLVVGPTGGTWRKSQHMLERFRQDLKLQTEPRDEYMRHRGLDGRLDITLILNPEDKILHTVLVEKNGFIHGLTFAGPYEKQADQLWGPVNYEKWIQPE
ncbi:MAG: hypothetical protein ABIG44_08445 [Planctomycetota bacterium]